MKQILFICLLASFFSCNSGSKGKYKKADTLLIYGLYSNQYTQTSQIDTAICIIHDSAHVDGDQVTHLPDSVLYVKVNVPVPDSTHLHPLKRANGTDSTILQYLPLSPLQLHQTWGQPIHFRTYLNSLQHK
jgi:hypothetical protein